MLICWHLVAFLVDIRTQFIRPTHTHTRTHVCKYSVPRVCVAKEGISFLLIPFATV